MDTEKMKQDLGGGREGTHRERQFCPVDNQ